MSQNRREFLRLLALGVIGHELDIDRLLWVPGRKTIFIPNNPTISLSQLIATEWMRLIPKIREIFERDDIFYKVLTQGHHTVEAFEHRIPLIYTGKEIKIVDE